MRYLGGKYKTAKHFLPLLLKDRKPDQYFVEPFCGGCNVTIKVEGPRIANDLNRHVISMYTAIQAGWNPPDYVSFHDYEKIRNDPDKYPSHLVGFVGVGISFGAAFMDVYARANRGIARTREVRKIIKAKEINYCTSFKKRVLKDAEYLRGVKFSSVDYRMLPIPPRSIVYCDPPYAGTKGYKTIGDFDSVAFWAWVRNTSMYHTVFVSEYNAPKDFKVVWRMKRKDVTDAKAVVGKEVVEKIFVWKNAPKKL